MLELKIFLILPLGALGYLAGIIHAVLHLGHWLGWRAVDKLRDEVGESFGIPPHKPEKPDE